MLFFPSTMLHGCCQAYKCMPRELSSNNNGTFNNVLVNLPEWSPSRNCLKSEAISNEECIHLSVPSVERENFTDGEWIGLVVASALGCSAYWLKLLYCGWPSKPWLHCKQDRRYIEIHKVATGVYVLPLIFAL